MPHTNLSLFPSVKVVYSDLLSPEELREILFRMRSPQIILWYIGTRGLSGEGVRFYREALIAPILEHHRSASFWLVDLTAWSAFKNPHCSVRNFSRAYETINKMRHERVCCIRSADLFLRMEQIEDAKLIKGFETAFRNSFETSKYFLDSGIRTGDLFGPCPIIKSLASCDANKTYSAIQYLEGCLLVEELLLQRSAKGEREVEIVFALPNDELKYYPRETFQKDLQIFLAKRNLSISAKVLFMPFKYGTQPSDRPYNAPGKVLKKGKLLQEEIMGHQPRITFRSESGALHVEIETERLRIRSYQDSDFKECVTLYGDASITKYFDSGMPRTEEEVRELIRERASYFPQGKPFGLFSVFHKKSGNFLGQVDFFPSEGAMEIGFILHERYQNQGFCTETMRAILVQYLEALRQEFAFPIRKVVATAHPFNYSSQKVLQKLGMRFEKEEERFGHPRLWYQMEVQ